MVVRAQWRMRFRSVRVGCRGGARSPFERGGGPCGWAPRASGGRCRGAATVAVPESEEPGVPARLFGWRAARGRGYAESPTARGARSCTVMPTLTPGRKTGFSSRRVGGRPAREVARPRGLPRRRGSRPDRARRHGGSLDTGDGQAAVARVPGGRARTAARGPRRPVSKISIRPWTVVDGFGSRRATDARHYGAGTKRSNASSASAAWRVDRAGDWGKQRPPDEDATRASGTAHCSPAREP